MISMCFLVSSVQFLVTFARAAQKQIFTQWCEALSSISGDQGHHIVIFRVFEKLCILKVHWYFEMQLVMEVLATINYILELH